MTNYRDIEKKADNNLDFFLQETRKVWNAAFCGSVQGRWRLFQISTDKNLAEQKPRKWGVGGGAQRKDSSQWEEENSVKSPEGKELVFLSAFMFFELHWMSI